MSGEGMIVNGAPISGICGSAEPWMVTILLAVATVSAAGPLPLCANHADDRPSADIESGVGCREFGRP